MHLPTSPEPIGMIWNVITASLMHTMQLSSPPLEVVLYHIKGWTTAGPPPVASLLNVMGEVADIQKEKDRPVLVMCE